MYRERRWARLPPRTLRTTNGEAQRMSRVTITGQPADWVGSRVFGGAQEAAVTRPAGPDGLDLARLISAILRRWPRILLATLAALGLGIAYLMFATPMYTSHAQFFVDPRGRNIVDSQLFPPGLGPDAVLMESQVKLLQSFTVLERVVRQEKLASDPEFARPSKPGLLSSIIGRPRKVMTAEEQARELEATAVVALSRQLVVRRTINTYIIDTQITTEDGAKSARVMQAIADAYLADQAGAKSDEARRVNSAIGDRLQELRDAVRVADSRVEEYRRTSGLLQTEGFLFNEQQITRINTALITAQTTTADAQARFDRIQRLLKQGGTPDTMPEAVSSLAIQNLRNLYARTAQREASLSARLRPGHPELVDAQSQSASVRAQIVAELQRISAATLGELQVAQERERQLKRNLDDAVKELSEKNQGRVKLAELEREATSGRRVLETYMARAKETKEQQTLFTPDARVITAATLPSNPSRPNRRTTLAAALLAGLGLGLAWAALPLMFAGTGRTPPPTRAEAVGRSDTLATREAPVPNIALLARVPSFNTLEPGRSRFGRRPTPAPAGPYAGFARVCESVRNVGDPQVAPYWSAVMRVADHLVTGVEGPRARSCLLTASAAGAGTSTTALALAISEAQAGSRVLLIDADSAKPDLASVFSGLGRAAGEAEPQTITDLSTAISRDAASGLEFLPFATLVGRPTRLMRPVAAVSALREMLPRYDLVIVDAGVLALSAAGRMLSTVVDETILVGDAALADVEIGTYTQQERLDPGRPSAVVLVDRG